MTFTCVLTKLVDRACLTRSQDDLSIHDLDPYSSVIVLSSRSSCIRLSMGFLAQPKPDIMAWNALSPLFKNSFSLICCKLQIILLACDHCGFTYVGFWALHWWIYCAIKLSSALELCCSTTSWNFRRISGLVFCTTHWPYDPAADRFQICKKFQMTNVPCNSIDFQIATFFTCSKDPQWIYISIQFCNGTNPQWCCYFSRLLRKSPRIG